MERLRNHVQPYAWGSPDAIPDLLGTPADGRPQAELWIGAHPALPSDAELSDGHGIPLDRLIAADPRHALGPGGGELPFLLKVLGVAAPLSIQAHPNAAQAAAGFARENAAGLAPDAPDRSYRDPHPKPELVCALTPFDALCGFRSADEAAADLEALGGEALAGWSSTIRRRGAGGRPDTLRELLGLDPDECRTLVRRVRAGAVLRPERFGWLLPIADQYPDDPGVLVALLLRRLTLQPGEALFLDAGVLHAYLGGTAVEVMGNSDNVLRGGLTAKHVDVAELLSVLDPDADPPPVRHPEPRHGCRRYPTAGGFGLTVAALPEAAGESVRGPALVLGLAGSATLSSRSGGMTLDRGESAFVAHADGPVELSGSGTLVWAGAEPSPP